MRKEEETHRQKDSQRNKQETQQKGKGGRRMEGREKEERGKDNNRPQRPWDDKQLETVSKKELIEWLQHNASNSFLQKHGLQGKVSNVAKKSKKVLDASFQTLFKGERSSFRQEKDEEESRKYQETFCRTRRKGKLLSLKVVVLRFIGKNIKQFQKVLLRNSLAIPRWPSVSIPLRF